MKKYITITGALIFSYIIVRMMTPQVFIQNSPTLDPQFIANVKDLPALLEKNGNNVVLIAKKIFSGVNVGRSPGEPIPQSPLLGLSEDQIPAGLEFSSFVKGVAAAEDKTTGKKYIKMSAGTKYKMSGRTMKVKVNGIEKEVPIIEIID